MVVGDRPAKWFAPMFIMHAPLPPRAMLCCGPQSATSSKWHNAQGDGRHSQQLEGSVHLWEGEEKL